MANVHITPSGPVVITNKLLTMAAERFNDEQALADSTVHWRDIAHERQNRINQLEAGLKEIAKMPACQSFPGVKRFIEELLTQERPTNVELHGTNANCR